MKHSIVLVGTGHWSNPALDFKTSQFDDMLAAGRQQEIADLRLCEQLGVEAMEITEFRRAILGEDADDVAEHQNTPAAV